MANEQENQQAEREAYTKLREAWEAYRKLTLATEFPNLNREKSPCERDGHDYRNRVSKQWDGIEKEIGWMCTKCGQVAWAPQKPVERK